MLGYGGQNPVSGDGWSMLCPSTNIPIENHRFGFTSDDYFSKTSLSSTSANSGLNILKQTNPSSLSSNSTYWQIQVPGMEIALCNGTVRFIAGAS